MLLASTALQEVLLALKLAFLVFLYLFIWTIVRTAGRDLRVPHADRVILRPAVAAEAGYVEPQAAPGTARLVVQRSPILAEGEEYAVDSVALTIGRGGQNDLALEGDEFSSARHARVEPLPDGVWAYDLGSTNGTYVNGERLDGARRLVPGDVLRVGETDLRYEE
ncbi:MAG TPA: FHA domain-containing protein [Gaiellaceae bacterium]|nr:FHA domain-containing protein [Gaiellaceae bacterium]